MRSIVPLSAMMRGFAGKVSSLANFNMVLEALKAHFPQQLYTLMHTIHYLDSRWYLRSTCCWYIENRCASRRNFISIGNFVSLFQNKFKKWKGNVNTSSSVFFTELHKKPNACANNNNKIPKSMWIIEKDPLQRDKSPFGKLATNPLQDTPWSDAYFPAMVLVPQVFFVMTKVLGVSKFQPPFPQFWKTYWRAVKTPPCEAATFQRGAKQRDEKGPKAPRLLFYFLLPCPLWFSSSSSKRLWEIFRESEMEQKSEKSRIQRDETILKRWHWLHLFLYRTGAVVDLLVSLPFFAGCSDCHRWLAARLSGGLARNMCLFFLLNWDVISPKPWADIVSRHIWRLTFVVTNSTAPSTAAAAHNNPLGRLVLALYDTFVKIYQIVWNFYFLLI